MPAPALAYVVSRWGEPTQTFVRREAEAVEALGADVVALSLQAPGSAPSPVRAVHLSAGSVVVGALRATLRHPVAVGAVLGTVVAHSARRNVLPQLVAAVIGVAWVGSGAARGRSLHAHFGWVATTSAWAAARVGGVPHTTVLHAFELHGWRYQDGFTPIPLRAAAQVFVISEADRAIVAERWGIDAAVLRMGVPAGWLVDVPTPPVDRTRLVAVGSLVPKKGHAVLLAALARCAHPYRLEVVGEGPLAQALDAQSTALGLRSRVELVGLLPEDEVRQRLAAAAVSVLAATEDPSGDRDGIPVALMEAMALGVPVISTRVGAIAELVEGAGLVVAPDDPTALAEALDSLWDPDARAALAAAGLARVRSAWTAEAGARQVLDVHRAVGG